jgi:hypothetical protein
MDTKGLFIEETIINSVKNLLSGRVNELLGTVEYPIPPIECTPALTGGIYATSPVIRLSAGERTEKERVIGVEVYTLTIAFAGAEPDGERNSYAYAALVTTALREDPTLSGTADRAAVVKKEYTGPKHPGTGGDWEAVVTLRITLEGIGL